MDILEGNVMVQSQSNKDAQILANTENLPHGKWGNKVDLNYAGKLANTLEPSGFKDFPINVDSKSRVFHPGIDPDVATPHPATHYRVRNNGDGNFMVFQQIAQLNLQPKGKKLN